MNRDYYNSWFLLFAKEMGIAGTLGKDPKVLTIAGKGL